MTNKIIGDGWYCTPLPFPDIKFLCTNGKQQTSYKHQMLKKKRKIENYCN